MTMTTLTVTQPYLPPLEEFVPYLAEVWDSRILTNAGPQHQKLEAALCEYLGVEHLSLFANGTLALITALQALDLRGEVITTPFTFVASAHALRWNGLTPVFVDIDPVTLNLDPQRIAAAITPRTTAIMPVHCYGHACDTAAIQAIADAHGLRVIYDAAHAFGVEQDGRSILRAGDLSVLSFHATKVFNTFEGGAIVCRDAATKQRIDRLRNFGFDSEMTVADVGMNGKMSEIGAAFGLLQLQHVDRAMERRREIDAQYRAALAATPGLTCLIPSVDQTRNCSYFPILVGASYPLTRDALFEQLRAEGIMARRYFHPLVSDFATYRDLPSADPAGLPVARRCASQVLCLPIYPAMSDADVARVTSALRATLRRAA